MPPTKEAIDDAKEAAHRANNRRDNFVAPLDLLVAAQKTVSAPTLSRWGELKGQKLGCGGHDDHDGQEIAKEGRVGLSGSEKVKRNFPFKKIHLKKEREEYDLKITETQYIVRFD